MWLGWIVMSCGRGWAGVVVVFDVPAVKLDCCDDVVVVAGGSIWALGKKLK